MKSADYFAKGLWNFFCDFCGAKRKSSDGVKSWQGNWICKEHREVRNPQDFFKGIKDDQSVPWSRPEPSDQFIPSCNFTSSCAVPGYGTAGCMIPGRKYVPW